MSSLTNVISGIEESITNLEQEIAELNATIEQKQSHISDLQELKTSASTITSNREIVIVHNSSTAVQ